MKNIFNKRLFVEAIRQIKLPLALFFGIMVGSSAIMTFINIITAKKYYEIQHGITTVAPDEALMHLCLCYAIIIPVFVLVLFKFLNKRNASDFYHAIPQTRTCIIFTYTLAILLVTTALLVISTLIPVISYSIADRYINFSVSAALTNMLNTFVCMVLVLGATLLSSSLTGTFSTNILFALVILFAPRFIMYMLTEVLSLSLNEILFYQHDFGFFSPTLNIVYSKLSGFILYEYDTNMNFASWATLYTFVLGVIYIILSFVTFNKRASEQAENSTNNHFAHNITRICIGLFFGIFAIQDYFLSNGDLGFETGIQIFIYIFVGFAAMTLYEIFTTKKAKRILIVLASLPVIGAICIIINIGLSIAQANILAYVPEEDKIDYIQYLPYADYYDYETMNYYENEINQVHFQNNELIKFLADAYTTELEAFKLYMNSDNDYWFGDALGKDTIVNIKFVEGNKVADRQVYLSNSEYEKFISLIYSDENYKAIFKSLPEEYSLSSIAKPFTETEVEKILSTYKDELKNLSSEDAATALGLSPDGINNSLYDFQFTVLDGSDEYYFNVYITPTTPKALDVTLDILNNKAKAQSSIITEIADKFNKLEDYDNQSSHFWFNARIIDLETLEPLTGVYFDEYSINDFEYRNYGYDDFNTLRKDVTSFLENQESSSENAKYFVFLDCNESLKGDYHEYSTFFFSNDTDFVEKILDYYQGEDEMMNIIYE